MTLEPTRRPLAGWTALVWVLPIVALARHIERYLPFVADDALISFRYSRRLLEGAGLTWTDGERVEGYSNLLWVLLTAALGATGVDLILAARVLGVASVLAGFLAIAWGLRRHPFGVEAAALAALLAALTGPVAVWSIAGMEQPLVMATAAWAVALAVPHVTDPNPRRALAAGIPGALLCLTRPDGPLLIAALAAVVVAKNRSRTGLRTAVSLGLVPAAAVAAQLAFRLAYYGEWIPNTGRIKASVTAARVEMGLDYWRGFAWTHWPLCALAVAAVAALAYLAASSTRGTGERPRPRRVRSEKRSISSVAAHLVAWLRASEAPDVLAGPTRPSRGPLLAAAVVAWVLVLTWMAYIASVGGDFFPAYRHGVVVVGLLAWPLAAGFAHLLAARRFVVTAVTVAVAGAILIAQARASDENTRAVHERWEWDGQVIGEAFHRAFSDARPLLAVTAAGTLPYFSRLPALDMQGLNDAHIARKPPAFGGLGHDHGDGRYVLDREPDLVAFKGVGQGPPVFVSGTQMLRDPRFRRDYREVRFEGHDPYWVRSRTWVRVHGRVGIQVREHEIDVPAYILAGAVHGTPGPDGRMWARLEAGGRVTSEELPLSAGAWTVTLDPPAPHRVGLEVEVRGTTASSPPHAPGTVVLDGDGTVRVAVITSDADVLVRRLLFKRAHRAHLDAGGVPDERTPSLDAGAAPETQTGGTWLTLTTVEPRPYTRRLLASFSNLDGWTRSGDLADLEPARGAVGSQTPVSGTTGLFLNTFQNALHARAGDDATGTAVSPPFVPAPGDVLELRVAGGDDAATVGVALVVIPRGEPRVPAGERRMTWTGERSEVLTTRRFDLSPYAGATLTLEVFDRAGGAWGHVLADEIALLSPAEPLAAQVRSGNTGPN